MAVLICSTEDITSPKQEKNAVNTNALDNKKSLYKKNDQNSKFLKIITNIRMIEIYKY